MQHKVLIIESDAILQRLFALNLKVWLNCDVQAFSQAKFALNFLYEHSDEIELILTRDKCYKEKTYKDIQDALKAKKIIKDIILLSDDDKKIRTNDLILVGDFPLKELIGTLGKKLGISAQDMAKLEHDEFYQISSQTLIPIDTCPIDIYEKEDEGETIVFAKGEPITQVKLDEMNKDLAHTLLVKPDERLKLVMASNQAYQQKIKEALTSKQKTEQASQESS